MQQGSDAGLKPRAHRTAPRLCTFVNMRTRRRARHLERRLDAIFSTETGFVTLAQRGKIALPHGVPGWRAIAQTEQQPISGGMQNKAELVGER